MSEMPEGWVGEQVTALGGPFPARGPPLRPPLRPMSPQPGGEALRNQTGLGTCV